MSDRIAQLEEQLNDFDGERRRSALCELVEQVEQGNIVFPEPKPFVNLHGHTFFSFNGYGYSPSYFAWRARREGLLAAGIVDFDVLDAADEFLEAGRLLGLRATAGIETRVFVPEFADNVMNSPGEPGIAYLLGFGFTTQESADQGVLDKLKAIAQRRNVGVLSRVNPHLNPVEIDYESDVLPLTPNGNATERHLCAAYDRKARERFQSESDLVSFWQEKLGVEANAIREALASPPVIQGLIRSRTMKAGGVGYVQPAGPDFPTLDRVARFVLEANAIPAYGWLDGTTDGEQDIERLLDTAAESGAAAVNVIPDRNWDVADPDLKKAKVANLERFIKLAQERFLPIAVGTEMNAYGQRFVDEFDTPELRPFVAEFARGAYIIYAHTILERHAAMGYLSPWARTHFVSPDDRNEFYAAVGKLVSPDARDALQNVDPDLTPAQVLDAVR